MIRLSQDTVGGSFARQTLSIPEHQSLSVLVYGGRVTFNSEVYPYYILWISWSNELSGHTTGQCIVGGNGQARHLMGSRWSLSKFYKPSKFWHSNQLVLIEWVPQSDSLSVLDWPEHRQQIQQSNILWKPSVLVPANYMLLIAGTPWSIFALCFSHQLTEVVKRIIVARTLSNHH